MEKTLALFPHCLVSIFFFRQREAEEKQAEKAAKKAKTEYEKAWAVCPVPSPVWKKDGCCLDYLMETLFPSRLFLGRPRCKDGSLAQFRQVCSRKAQAEGEEEEVEEGVPPPQAQDATAIRDLDLRNVNDKQ